MNEDNLELEDTPEAGEPSPESNTSLACGLGAEFGKTATHHFVAKKGVWVSYEKIGELCARLWRSGKKSVTESDMAASYHEDVQKSALAKRASQEILDR